MVVLVRDKEPHAVKLHGELICWINHSWVDSNMPVYFIGLQPIVAEHTKSQGFCLVLLSILFSSTGEAKSSILNEAFSLFMILTKEMCGSTQA